MDIKMSSIKRVSSSSWTPTKSDMSTKKQRTGGYQHFEKVVPSHLEQPYRNILKIRDKLLRFTMHKETLSKYAELDLIPKGLCVSITPSFGSSDPEFMEKWNSTLHSCSLQLIDLIINQCDTINTNLDNHLAEQSQVIADGLQDDEQFEIIQDKVNSITERKRIRIQKTKDKKLQRDICLKEDLTRDDTETNAIIQSSSSSKNEVLRKAHQPGNRNPQKKLVLTRTVNGSTGVTTTAWEELHPSYHQKDEISQTAEVPSIEELIVPPVSTPQAETSVTNTLQNTPTHTRIPQTLEFHIPELVVQTTPPISMSRIQTVKLPSEIGVSHDPSIGEIYGENGRIEELVFERN